MADRETDGSGTGSKILGLFWKSGMDEKADGDEKEEHPAKTTVKPAAPAARPHIVGGALPPESASAPLPQVDPQVRAQLEKAMLSDNDNSVGQFMAARASLAEDITEPDRLLRVVLKTLKSQGLTPEMILADIASDEKILLDQERKFQIYISGKRQSGLGDKQKEMDSIAKTITEKRQAIEALQREIAQLETRQGTLQSATAAEARQYADVEARFATTLAAVRDERAQLKSNIQPYVTTKGALIMTEEKTVTNIANLPKFGSFWSRPEGKFGGAVLALGGLALLGALYVFGPILLSIIWTTTKIAALCGGLFTAWIVGSNKRFRNLISELFASAMDKAYYAMAKRDPYGLVRRYVRYLKERIGLMDGSIATVMGQSQGLNQLIVQQSEQTKQLNGILTQARKKRPDGDPYVKNTARQIGRLENSTTLLQREFDRNRRAIEVLKKLREESQFVVEDTEQEVELQIRTHKVVSANQAAFSDATAIINGDTLKKEGFDIGMSILAEDTAAKIGQIEMSMESIKDALTTKEFETDASAAAVLARLDATEKNAGELRKKYGDRPSIKEEVAEPVLVGANSDFDSLMKK